MALGIKKITESVIEDGRSLTMIGTYNKSANGNKGAMENFDENKAIPLGAVIASTSGVLRIKNGENSQVRINADEKLELLTVSTRVIANSAVTTEKIKDLNVTTAKINNAAVTTDKIKDLNVTTAKINNLAVTTAKIDNSAVTTDKIKDLNVTTPKLAANAITTVKIQNAAVTTDKIAYSAVTTDKLLNSAVTTIKINNEAVTTDKLATNSVSTVKIQNAAVTESKIDPAFLAKYKESIRQQTDSQIRVALDEFKQKWRIDLAVKHDGNRSITGQNESTALINLKCSGDIEGKRVFFMTYQDLAEGYVPGEELEAGDIVAMHEDGKVYKAESINDCIVGVISNEFANCLGATKEELFNGSKVAVGMIGKVHVKVKGPVKIGQKISVSMADAGVGVAGNMAENIGKALESIDCDFDEVHDVLVQIRPM